MQKIEKNINAKDFSKTNDEKNLHSEHFYHFI